MIANFLKHEGNVLSNGFILDIKRYAIHDGPGIRTTVFLKGCPLSCQWCHNPESQRERPEILYYEERCTLCGACASVCKHGAIGVVDDHLTLDQSLCVGCGDCVRACPNDARKLAGRVMSVDQVVLEIVKDTLFYEESGGGVTLSGGEPLMQAEFTRDIAARCHELDIHSALDTSGYAPEEALIKVAGVIDLFLYDVKTLDDATHLAHTGVSNRSILRNLRMLDDMRKRIWIRFPLVPGVNDDEHSLSDLIDLICSLRAVESLQVLPYHRAGAGKYQRLGREYAFLETEEPSGEDAAAYLAKGTGLPMWIGG